MVIICGTIIICIIVTGVCFKRTFKANLIVKVRVVACDIGAVDPVE